MNFESLPTEFLERSRWCFTGSTNDEDESNHKVPHVLHEGMFYKLDVTAHHAYLLTWSQISQLKDSYPDRQIGWVLTKGDGLTCIDLDVKNDTPVEITARNANLIEQLQTYVEVSQSGVGYHVWLKGEVNGAIKTSNFEVYSKERFIIFTGQAINDFPLRADPELIESFNEQINSRQFQFEIDDEAQTKDDQAIIDEVYAADHTGKFHTLMIGDWHAYDRIMASQGNYQSFDPSQADAAFMTIVTYFTGNFEQCKRLWRMSALADVTRRYPNDPAEQRRKARNMGTEYKLNRAIKHGKEKNAIDRAMRDQAVEDAKKNVGNLIEQAKAKACEGFIDPIQDIPYPPGKLGDLARYFNDISLKQIPMFAITEALACAAAMFGRVYNVSGTGLNSYFMVLAPSGTGKSALSANPAKLFKIIERERGVMGASKFVMTQRFTHENAMLKEFQERTSFTQCLSEFGKIFKNMMTERAGPNVTVREGMTDIYSKSGAYDTVGGLRYTQQENVVTIDHSVAFSFLGESVAEPFFENVGGDVLSDGFMSRFVVLEYAGKIPYDHESLNTYPSEPLMKHLEQACSGCLRALMDANNVQVANVGFSPDAETWRQAYARQCTDKANEKLSDPIHTSIWNRANLKVLKIAALCAVMDVPWQPQITVEHLEWAQSVVNAHGTLISNAVKSGRMGSVHSDQGIDTLHQIMTEFFTKENSSLTCGRVKQPKLLKSNFCVPLEYIMRIGAKRAAFKATSSYKKPRDIVRECLRDMEDAGTIQKLSQKESLELFKTTAVIYRLLR